jgi:Flp pilus assembly protein TadB
LRQRKLRWDPPPTSTLPKRPYRDTALVYGGMALIVVIIAWLTGGGVLKAVVIAGLFFVAATLWTWRSWRNRLRAERAQAQQKLP